jgi:hypothetical protein
LTHPVARALGSPVFSMTSMAAIQIITVGLYRRSARQMRGF